ncbi:hypothetical protein BU17DRAFT_60305 [Hysterangium stoloniferum]|nr:hypothetical protein BU17DRAFT_60305 [Hysterangium stoloniferum]
MYIFSQHHSIGSCIRRLNTARVFPTLRESGGDTVKSKTATTEAAQPREIKTLDDLEGLDIRLDDVEGLDITLDEPESQVAKAKQRPRKQLSQEKVNKLQTIPQRPRKQLSQENGSKLQTIPQRKGKQRPRKQLSQEKTATTEATQPRENSDHGSNSAKRKQRPRKQLSQEKTATTEATQPRENSDHGSNSAKRKQRPRKQLSQEKTATTEATQPRENSDHGSNSAKRKQRPRKQLSQEKAESQETHPTATPAKAAYHTVPSSLKWIYISLLVLLKGPLLPCPIIRPTGQDSPIEGCFRGTGPNTVILMFAGRPAPLAKL